MNILKVLGLTVTLLFLAAGCAGSSSGGGNGSDSNGGGENGGNAEPSATNSAQSGTTETEAATGETRVNPESTVDAVEGTTGPSGTTPSGMTGVSQAEDVQGDVRVEQLSSGAMGPERRQILIASSAQDLAAATGIEVPDAGEGTYVAVAWGEKPTGGYTVGLDSASEEGARVTVNVALEDPPPDAMVAQAITYPYAVAFLPGVDPGEHEFVFVTQNGREIGWPVRSV